MTTVNAVEPIKPMADRIQAAAVGADAFTASSSKKSTLSGEGPQERVASGGQGASGQPR